MPDRTADRTIRQVTAAAIAGAVILAASFGVDQWQRYEDTRVQAERSLKSTASLLAEHTARTFDAAEATMRVVATIHAEASAGKYDRATIHKLLKAAHGGSPIFKAIGWVDADGNRTASSLFADPPPLNVAEDEQFRVHRDGTAPPDQLYTAAPKRSALLGSWIVSVSMRIDDPQGHFAGIVGGVVDPTYFSGVYHAIDTRPSDVVTLFRGDGTILARDPMDEAMLGVSLAGRRFMTEVVPSGPSGAFQAWGLSDGLERIIGYAVVPGGGFIVTVAATRQELFAEFWRGFLSACGILALMLVGLGAGAWLLIRQEKRRGTLAGELRISESRFRDFAASSGDWFWETDDQHRVTWISDTIEKVLGVPASWHIGKSRTDIASSASTLSDAWKEHLQCLSDRHAFRDFEYFRNGPTGVRWIRVSGVPVFGDDGDFRGYRGSGRDVTALKQAEARLRDAVESIPGGFLLFDPDGRLAYVNKNSAKYVPEMAGTDRIGDTFEAILRRTLAERLIVDAYADPEGWLAWRLERHRAAQGNSTLVHYESRIVEVVERPTSDGGVIVLRFDVTQREREREATQKARDAADAANRAKSEFLASMSHELRTPLNAVIGFGHLLLVDQSAGLSPRGRPYAEHIVNSGKHLLSLIDDVLDLASIEAGRLKLTIERLPADDAIIAAVDSIRPVAAKAGIAIERLSISGLPDIRGDSQRVRQVLLNLLSNAIKYNRSGGSVTVSAQAIDDTRLRISIADTGKGIAAENAGEIFAPFQRLGAEFTTVEGTGIGLSVCKLLVEAMNGRIGFTSEPGVGSTFWIELPIEAEAPAALPGVQEAPASDTPLADAGGFTLLYVEDNPLNLQLVEYLMETLPGVTTLSAPSGAIGLDLARTRRPDVIILDLNLPEMNGFEILERLQRDPATRDIPAIALTASAMPNDVERGLAAGFFRYLAKPIDFAAFMAAIDAALSKRQADRRASRSEDAG